MRNKTLYRSCKNRIIGGVAGGLGEYFEIDPVLIRLVFVLLAIPGGAGVIIYLISWLIIPEDPSCAGEKPANEEIKEGLKKEPNSEPSDKKSVERENKQSEGRAIAGLVVLAFGVVFLVQNITGINLWTNFWPIVLIIIGLGVILSAKNRR